MARSIETAADVTSPPSPAAATFAHVQLSARSGRFSPSGGTKRLFGTIMHFPSAESTRKMRLRVEVDVDVEVEVEPLASPRWLARKQQISASFITIFLFQSRWRGTNWKESHAKRQPARRRRRRGRRRYLWEQATHPSAAAAGCDDDDDDEKKGTNPSLCIIHGDV